MSEFKNWYCPEHGPKYLSLSYVYEAEKQYGSPWLQEVATDGTLVFTYSDSDYEETGGEGRWVLGCWGDDLCRWTEERLYQEITTDAPSW